MIKLHTNHGVITLELNEEKAPVTCENFKQYVKDGHYDGTIFHRVIDSFMIQGGGMDRNFKEKSSRDSIKNEADNGLKNDQGTIAMARTSDPHSASAQFFINVKDNDFLNFKNPSGSEWGYAVFGKVVDGMEVVETIRKVETGSRQGHQDVPLEPIIIEKAEWVD